MEKERQLNCSNGSTGPLHFLPHSPTERLCTTGKVNTVIDAKVQLHCTYVLLLYNVQDFQILYDIYDLSQSIGIKGWKGREKPNAALPQGRQSFPLQQRRHQPARAAQFESRQRVGG